MAEHIAFYLDEHIPKAIADALRRRDVDVIMPYEVGRSGLSDEEQLAWARSQDRVLVTFDDDFLALNARGLEHAGIAFCAASKYSVGELIKTLLTLHSVLAPNEMRNRVEFL